MDEKEKVYRWVDDRREEMIGMRLRMKEKETII